MIRGAFQHLPGIGPRLRGRLSRDGVNDCSTLLKRLDLLPLDAGHRGATADEIARSEKAARNGDLHYLAKTLARPDHWRILADHLDRASFFDVETEGIQGDSPITVIACLHAGRLLVLTRDEGFEEFLELLDDVALLVSFNGNSFDLPRLEKEFHIPAVPCPHIDLRWVCYHAGLRGGLKGIEKKLGILRPADLEGIDGAEAERLWRHWTIDHNDWARNILKRYCGADALALKMVTARLLESLGGSPLNVPEDWSLLGAAPERPPLISEPSPGPSAPVKERARNRMLALRAKLREARVPDGSPGG